MLLLLRHDEDRIVQNIYQMALQLAEIKRSNLHRLKQLLLQRCNPPRELPCTDEEGCNGPDLKKDEQRRCQQRH